MKFEKISDQIYGAECQVFVKALDRHVKARLRIDGRTRDGTYRVDYLGMFGHIWEAIDDGPPGFPTLADAQRYAKAWCTEANAQETLDPRGMERHRHHHPEHARTR